MKPFFTIWPFVLLLLRQSSIKKISTNYEKERMEILKDLPLELASLSQKKKHNLPSKLLSILLKIRLMRFLLENIAFLKNPGKSYKRLYLSSEKRLIYLRIFKCGSTSVLRSLLPTIHKPLKNIVLTDKQVDSIAHYLEKNHLVDTNDYFAFTVVRNPMERVVSAYIDIFSGSSYGDFLFGVFHDGMSFKDVLTTLSKIPDRLRGPHFCSQSTIINCSGLKNLVYFKLGEDNEKLIHFLSQFDLSFNHSNRSPIKYDYKYFYDVETLKLVYEVYKNDFTYFDYNSEYQELFSSLKSN
ncbi:MAG TPA: sulfotransferase family 2 domain-containing protein [Cyclobacteriaceae bacterium]|nr:sulfotransferase family 2 domain-containing protein [Cyclobacteriaceae bacterium]